MQNHDTKEEILNVSACYDALMICHMKAMGKNDFNQQLQAEKADLNVFKYLLLLSVQGLLYFIKIHYIDRFEM